MTFAATHVAPEGGLRAWASADAAQPPAATIDAGVPLQVLDWSGAWAHVICDNAWSAWVDGRLLLPFRATTAATPPAPTAARPAKAFPVPLNGLAGAATAVVSVFVPWVRAKGLGSFKPFDVPVGVLVNSTKGFDLGLLVVVLALGLCLPQPQARLAAVVALVGVAIVFAFRLESLSILGPGVLIAVAGAAMATPLRLGQGTPGS